MPGWVSFFKNSDTHFYTYVIVLWYEIVQSQSGYDLTEKYQVKSVMWNCNCISCQIDHLFYGMVRVIYGDRDNEFLCYFPQNLVFQYRMQA